MVDFNKINGSTRCRDFRITPTKCDKCGGEFSEWNPLGQVCMKCGKTCCEDCIVSTKCNTCLGFKAMK